MREDKKPNKLFSGLSGTAFDPEGKSENERQSPKNKKVAADIETMKNTSKRRAYAISKYNIQRLALWKALDTDNEYDNDVNKLINAVIGRELDKLGIRLPGEE